MGPPLFDNPAPVRFDPRQPPVVVPVVDTEEEFAWGEGFFRDATSVKAIAGLDRFQSLCDEFGVRPTYVADYPVVSQPESAAVLRGYLESGRAVVGAHLHPWVNPPHEEAPCDRLSFPGNLEPELERAKIRSLADEHARIFGARPTIYKAGRHGLGPHTARILEEEGFEIDLSVHAGADLRAAGGPDFRDFEPTSFRFGRARRLLEIPVTSAYVGPLGRRWRAVHALAAQPWLSWARLRTVLSRLRLLERLRLSPEDMGPAEHKRLLRTLLRRGQRVFTFTFHSPSLWPGCTPYVRDEAGLECFLETCREFFRFFLEELGGRACTPGEVYERS